VLTKPFKHLRTKFLVSMLAVVFLLTASVLVLVQARMRNQVRLDLASTLRTESRVYAEIEKVRREQAQQSAELIANQASLKALMSTNDRLTVEDGSQSILPTTHADLLILENPLGEMLALHSNSSHVTSSVVKPLMQASASDEDWWFIGGHLYDVNLVPIVAGAGAEERLLGRMALGREIRRDSILNGGAFEKSAFTFERQGRVLLSSLPPDVWTELESVLPKNSAPSNAVREFEVRGERYLASVAELPGDHPVQLYCLQSYDQATNFLHALNRMLLILGAVAVLAGALIAFLLSRQITRPLEQLELGTQQLQKGDFEFQIPIRGNDEVADLGCAFDEMRGSLKKSRESMLRSARLEAVGRLAGGVAHDFNNLVMIIKGYSDMLLASAAVESRPHLEEIKRAGDRASALTRQLLAFSRKQILEPQVLDPNQTVRNMVKMLRVLIGEDIELVTSLADQIGRVQADPGQLEQVVMNLAVNARDAMPDGGKLVIETQGCYLDDAYVAANSEASPGHYVLIAVTDNGSGMSKETLAQIFEPFFTTKEQGKGTGLGLATVYGIVKQSRGHISVYSEVGHGTTFKVYLPALEKTVPVASPQSPGAAVKGAGTVLFVEDEPALRTLAVQSLKKLGYTVLEAGNGLEALAVVERHPAKIDVVVADIVMPRMGGPEFVEKLRAKRDDFAVIFMTGYTEASVLENAKIKSGAVVLNKPFSAEVLAAKINELQQQSGSSQKHIAAGASG
jgi:signal transduction histidine kinase/ActR/RegA family two-component response regulator